ncbi:unnamed protein product, partial [Closterium sp. NIES-53]
MEASQGDARIEATACTEAQPIAMEYTTFRHGDFLPALPPTPPHTPFPLPFSRPLLPPPTPTTKSAVQFLHDCQRAWNANLSGWNEIVYCDNAEGITCDSNGMVATLGLTGVGLQGPIPASISNLRELVDL